MALAQHARFRGVAAGRSLHRSLLSLDLVAIEGVFGASGGHSAIAGARWLGASRQLHSGWGLAGVPLSARPLLAAPRAEELIAVWLRDHRRSYSSENSPLAPPRVGVKLGSTLEKDDKDAPIAELQEKVKATERAAALARESEPGWLSSVGPAARSVAGALATVPEKVQELANMSRAEWMTMFRGWWVVIKREAHHLWVGSKLLYAEVKISIRLLLALRERSLSRRERQQLVRTTADIFRLVPFLVIVIIPFAEFALPLLLKVFPNLLPSTFQDQLKQEEGLKQQLKARIELAKFLQETTETMASQLAKNRGGEVGATATELYDFMRRVRTGAPVSNADIKRFAKLFNDELTLDTVDRVQLVNMCKFVGIAPYGTDTFLRYQLRKKLRDIRQDDRMIAAEGVTSLTYDELRAACRIRGMRWDGETTASMQKQLEDWLELSTNAKLPSSLLILSRAFTITHHRLEDADTAAVTDIRDTLASLPDEAFGKVEVQACVEEDSAEQKQRKLELLHHEEEMIKEEEEDRREAVQREVAAAGAAPPDAAASAAGSAAEPAEPSAASADAAAPAPLGAPDAGGAPSDAARITSVAEVEEISDQERKIALQKERRRMARRVARAIATLAASSPVLPERQEFQELVAKEIDRYDTILKNADEPVLVAADPATVRMSRRVNRMLTSLEKELNKVDASIGPKLHKLDLNADGVLDALELDAASLLLKDFMGDFTGSEDVREILGDVMDAHGRVKVQALLQLALEEDPDEAPLELHEEEEEATKKAT